MLYCLIQQLFAAEPAVLDRPALGGLGGKCRRSALPEELQGSCTLYLDGPSHCEQPSTSSGRGQPRLGRRRRRVLPAAAPPPTCRRVGARLRRGDRVVTCRGSRLHERFERPRTALSAAGQLQDRKPRRSPPYGDHAVSACRQGLFDRAGWAKEGRLSRWQSSAGWNRRPNARAGAFEHRYMHGTVRLRCLCAVERAVEISRCIALYRGNTARTPCGDG